MKLRPDFVNDSFEHEPEIARFRVLVLYTTRPAAIRAMRVISKIEELLVGTLRVDCEIWRVDVLDLPEVQQQIRWAGTIADLIVIASDTPRLSERVSEWLRKCVSEKRSGISTLVRLCSSPLTSTDRTPSDTEWDEQVRPLATGLDFFIHEIARKEPSLRKIRTENYPGADGCEWRVE